MKIGRWELRRHYGWAKPYFIRFREKDRIIDWACGYGLLQLARRAKKVKK